MAKTSIPKETQQEVVEIIKKFNQKVYGDSLKSVSFLAEFKGKYLYLKRWEYGKIAPIARLTYNGDMKNWDFAIFKWSRERYDPDEWLFPGSEYLDGTIEGAMKAGLEAYPV